MDIMQENTTMNQTTYNQLLNSDVTINHGGQIPNSSSLPGNQQYQQQQQQQPQINQQQVQFKKIDGSNNSSIYEMFVQIDGKQQSLNQVIKVVSHCCTKKGSKSQLKIHRNECQDLNNEYQIMSQLNHHNILPIEIFDSQKDFCAIRMIKADLNLFQFLQIQSTQNQRLPLSQIRIVFKQIAKGLHYLHKEKSLAHNDIKLANIFIFKKQSRITLADFGFAKYQTSQEMCPINQLQRWQNRATQTMAPELIQKVQQKNTENYIDEFAADIFSFGIMLFQSVFLTSPFSSQAATEDDVYYKKFYNKDFDSFFKIDRFNQVIRQYVLINEANSQINYLLDLIVKCLYVDPKERTTIDKIIKHPWLQTQEN